MDSKEELLVLTELEARFGLRDAAVYTRIRNFIAPSRSSR
ncbi:hypothetical protein HNR25_003915 [Streptomonospora salina]|uniref:Uncharacterized protein n=1 Tax=Streptomonospora salina TaxID=104205 RepID=A0A841ECN8_9ACTN|nr:hypothetical protein [Streptomonospora salina]